MRFSFLSFLFISTSFFAQDSTTVKSKSIKEVNISAQKPMIKLEAGKTTLETSNATIQQGTLKDLIQQIPGVILDNNNNVTVKGKSGLRILIDGKTSQLALSDIKSFMESIPATSIKSIEVLTNPGAQYDAEGKSGIINIKLKKDKREGFNTKLSCGMGTVFNKFSGGIFSNYKNDKLFLGIISTATMINGTDIARHASQILKEKSATTTILPAGEIGKIRIISKQESIYLPLKIRP
jgi:TonB-dependent Receptor Plug Domain